MGLGQEKLGLQSGLQNGDIKTTVKHGGPSFTCPAHVRALSLAFSEKVLSL